VTVKTIIVTRHPGLVEVLKKDHFIEGEVIPHATPEQIKGNIVVGVLPLHLAALASVVGVIDLNIPAELRGTELSAQQIREFSMGLTWYRVTQTDPTPVEWGVSLC
jgi:putative CRISPR-associated protein (TIGR02620 family)